MSRSLFVRVGGTVLGVSLLVMCPLASSRAVAAGDYPRVLQVQANRPPLVSVDVVVPPLLSGEILPSSAFELSSNGKRLVVTSADRLPLSDLRIMLVIDTAVPPAVLEAQLGAARDFLFELPAQARAGVIAGGPDPELVTTPGIDRSATVRALVGLRSQPPDEAVDVTPSLDLALGQLAPGGGNVVVAVDYRSTLTTVPYALSRAALDRRTAVYSIVLGRAAPGYLGGLPGLSGGRVLTVARPQLLVKAFDTVRSELQGRYRVGYWNSGQGEAVELVVTAKGVTAATTIPAEQTVEAASPQSAGSRPVALLAGVLVLITIAAVFVGRLSTPVAT